MVISKDRIFVSFAVYSGAWVLGDMLHWGLIEWQAANAYGDEGWFMEPGVHGAYFGAFVMMICAPVAFRAPLFLGAAFCAYTAVHILSQILFYQLLQLSMDPALHDAYYITTSFSWRRPGAEMVGYAVMTAAFFSAVQLQRRFAPERASPWDALLVWLEIRGKQAAEPGQRDNPAFGMAAALVAAVCCVASAGALTTLTASILTAPFMNAALSGPYAASDISPVAEFLVSYGASLVLLSAFGHLCGRLAAQLQLKFSAPILLAAVVLGNAQQLYTTWHLVVNADQVGGTTGILPNLIGMALTLLVTFAAIRWGQRTGAPVAERRANA